MRRPREAIARAVRRLQAEVQEPLAEVARFLNEPVRKVERWVIRGKGGVHLDGVRNPQRGWLSSIPAAVRFVRELYERDAEDLSGPAPAG